MAKVTVTVCDECGTQEGIKHFDIKEGTRKVSVDLCEAHSERLDQLLALNSPEPPRAAKRPSRARKKVMTMEEIEKLKKK